MSNFSSIGFPVPTEEDFDTLGDMVCEKGNPVTCGNYGYIVLSDISGAEARVQTEDDDPQGLTPYFNGKSRIQLKLIASMQSEQYMDGGYYAWVNPSEESDLNLTATPVPEIDTQDDEDTETPEGDYPIVFEVPEFHLKEHETPAIVTAQITCFAQQVTLYADEKDYECKNAGDESNLASKGFIPTGLFAPDDEEHVFEDMAFGIFTGEITYSKLCTNTFTGHTFYHLMVDTYGGEYDVVADPTIFEDTPPATGNYIQCGGWLTGKILD